MRVYVDGGDRSNGGYVQYLANGTLDRGPGVGVDRCRRGSEMA